MHIYYSHYVTIVGTGTEQFGNTGIYCTRSQDIIMIDVGF
jgi:hypothetical protein